MSLPEQEALDIRRKRTIWLMAGGAASLILPLLGVLYMRISEAKTARPPDSSVMFDRREKGEEKVNISQTVVAPAALAAPGASSLPIAGGMTAAPASGNGSSLDFVKGGANNTYFQDKAAAPAAEAEAAPPPPPAAGPSGPIPPASKTVAQKGGKKPFNMPKLQGTKQFSNFKSASPKPTGAPGGMTGVADPKAGKGDDDMAELLKNVPGGANNPEVQKYLKSK